jgi:very-short-patch-repair endonuclease
MRRGSSQSLEVRAKISTALCGDKNPMYGRHHSLEARAKISAAKRGRSLTAEHRARISAAGRGKVKTAEHQAKITAALRQRPSFGMLGKSHTPEARAKMAAANSGRPKSQEQRARQSTVMTQRWADPKRRARQSVAGKAHIGTVPGCRCAPCRLPRSPTKLEGLLIHVILAEFPEVKPQRWFGRYRVDAYLPPPYHLAFEADGEYWHGSPSQRKRDAKRDAWLLREFGLPVVRLTGGEIQQAAKVGTEGIE